ncbi:MAG: crossover junction endodeoxyribonuclease RuvC [Dehalococcoidales bacterium]|nr:crossover junction endodeoxyribonuclease RuvC [Dehalococcoidales bacterium]
MIILGIDPGTLVMGYGVIDSRGDEIALITCGALTGSAKQPIAERLSYLYKELQKIIRRYQPEAVAVEKPFVAKNVQSAMAIGRAQAIALLAAADKKIPTFEYTPARVKQSVANYGASSKEQIQQMVRLQLNMSELPEPSDAADALAVAICHSRENHLSQLLAKQGER